MDIKLQTQQDTIIAEISGEIDGKTSSLLQEKLIPLLTPQSKIILQMTEVSYLSSAGLRVLLMLYRQANTNSSQLVLVGLSEEVTDIMKITGFLKFFKISDTVENAI
ncbi:MAG: anti-sigma factor antagonist [Microcystaceae cyanobacterium]